jgi:hypothetical protein
VYDFHLEIVLGLSIPISANRSKVAPGYGEAYCVTGNAVLNKTKPLLIVYMMNVLLK